MLRKSIRRILSWIVTIALIVPSFISPFQTFAENPVLEITNGQTHRVGDEVTVRVTDIAANSLPDVNNEVTVNVTSAADTVGIALTLTETDINSSVFEGTFKVAQTTNTAASPQEIGVLFTDTVRVAYNGLFSDIQITSDFDVTVKDPSGENTLSNARVEIVRNHQSISRQVSDGSGKATFNRNFGGEGDVELFVFPPQETSYALARMTLSLENGTYTGNSITISLSNPMIAVHVQNPDGSAFAGGDIEVKQIIGTDEVPLFYDGFKSDGTYNLPVLGNGAYRLYAHPYFESAFSTSEGLQFIVDNGSVKINDTITTDPLEMSYSYTQVRGTVTKGADSASQYDIWIRPLDNPVTNWCISVQGGNYKASNLPLGQYIIKAYSREPGFTDSVWANLDVTDVTAVQSIDLHLTTPQVYGVVKAPGGTSAYTQGGCIEFYDQNHNYMQQPNLPGINNDGSFYFGGLGAGTYYIKAKPQDGSGLDSSDFMQVVIDSQGNCTSPASSTESPAVLILQIKEPKLIWTGWRARGDGQLEVDIRNYSLLGDIQNITVQLNGQPLEFDNIWGNPYNQGQDIGRLNINIPGGIKLPYGKYEVTLAKGEEPIAAADEASNDLYIVANTEITPKIVSPAGYKDGTAIITADVKPIDGQKAYPWNAESLIRARISNRFDENVPSFEVSVSVNADNNTLQFRVPSGMDESEYADGYRHVEFFNTTSGYPLAWGDFPVGTTRIDEVTCLEGKAIYLFGDYLNTYASDNTYGILYADGVKVAESNRWGSSDDAIKLDFDQDLLQGKAYRIEFYSNGQKIELPNNGTAVFVPRLTCDNPVITGNDPGESISISENGSTAWNAGDNLTLILRDRWGNERSNQNSSNGVEVYDDHILFTTQQPFESGIFTVEIVGGDGTKLGYTEVYMSGERPVLQGTVMQPGEAAAASSFGFVKLSRDDGWNEKYPVGPDGHFFIPSSAVDRGPGDYIITAYPTLTSGYSRSKPVIVSMDNNGNFTTGFVTLSLQNSVCTVQIRDPQGNPIDGNIEIQQYIDQERHTRWISNDNSAADGSYKVPPLEEGTYWITAHPAYGSEYVDSLRMDFEAAGNQFLINGSPVTELNLDLRTAQVEGTVKYNNDSLDQRYFSVYVYSTDPNSDMDQVSIIRDNGTYRLGGLVSGSYVLRIMKNDFEDGSFTSSFSQSFTIPSGDQPITLNFEMTDAQITGTVSDEHNNSINQGRVSVLDQNMNWYHYDTQIRNGSFRLGGLEDGTYYLQVKLDNMEGKGYPAYDAYELYKVVIQGGSCIEPVPADVTLPAEINLVVKDRKPRIDWIDTIQPGSDRICAHFVNQSLLCDPNHQEGLNNLQYLISDKDGHTYSAGPAYYSFTDYWQDRGDITIDIKQLPVLPYGKYSLEIIKDGLPIDAIHNNYFYIVGGTISNPTVVTAANFAGTTYTVDVTENILGKVYPWSADDTVFARVNHKDGLQTLKLGTSIDSNGILSFTIPGDANPIEGRYYLDFFKMVEGEEFLLAQGEFDVGTTQVDAITARQGEGMLTIKGDYLRKYMYKGAYAELYDGSQLVAKTFNFNDFWGDLQWFIPFRFIQSANYTINLYVPGQGQVLDNYPVQVVPYLKTDDPVIGLGSADTVMIRGIPNCGGSPIKVNLHGIWENRGITVKNTVLDEDTIFFTIPTDGNIEGTENNWYGLNENNYMLDIINGTTGEYIGYSMLYAANNPDRVIQGSVRNIDNSPATGGKVVLEERYGGRGWETVTDPDGRFYFNRFEIGDGDYRLIAQPPYNSGETADYEFVTLNGDGSHTGSFDLQYHESQVTGSLVMPDGSPVSSGFANISGKDGQFLYSVRVSPDGTFGIGGLEAGEDYYLSGSYDGPEPIMDSYGITIHAGSGALTEPLRLRNPQLSVAATANGQPVDFEIQILSTDPQKDFRYETRKNNKEMYIDKLETGSYNVSVVSGEIPYSQSVPATITIDGNGSCSPAALELALTSPKLTGQINTPSGDRFTEGYVEIFKDIDGRLQYVGGAPVNRDGNFYMGGIPDGEYYLRACVNEGSPAFGSYSASRFTRIQLEQGVQATLALNDKAPRFRSVQDAFIRQDRLRLRLINIESITDFRNLTAEILDSNGNSLPAPIIISGDKFGPDGNSYDRHVDEMDVELFIDGGLKLLPGQYQLQLKYNGVPLACDDSGLFNVKFSLFSIPGGITPDHTSGASVIFDIDRSEDMPYPWIQSDEISVDFYSSSGQKVSRGCLVNPDGKLIVVLPQMAEDHYYVEVVVNSQVMAAGGFVVGYPQIERINDMAEGDGGIALNGSNLEFFNGNDTAYAKIINSEGKPIYIDDYMNFDGQTLYIEFGSYGLQAGEYTLELGYDGAAMNNLPNGGKFRVVNRMYTDPAFLDAGSSERTVTLYLRNGVAAPWSEGDTLSIGIYGMDKGYVVDDAAITRDVINHTLSFQIPSSFGNGQYNIEVNKFDNANDKWLWIATSRLGIAESIQINGKITADGYTGIPFSGVNIFNDWSFYHFDADKNGNYFIYDLPLGSYRIQAVPPIGGKYIIPEEQEISISEGSNVQKDFVLQPGSLFTGTISLPEGKVAPAGGYKIGVLAWSYGPDGVESGDDAGLTFTEVSIPEGSRTARYGFLVSSAVTDYRIALWFPDDDYYIKQYYYKVNGTAFSKAEATCVSGASDKNGLDFNIVEGNTISGMIKLPDGAAVPPQGLDLQIVAIMDNDKDDAGMDDYVGWRDIHLSFGQTSAAYSLALPENLQGKGYTLFYELKQDGAFVRKGFFRTSNDTTLKEEEAASLDMSGGDKIGINLTLIRPQFSIVTQTPEGDSVDFGIDIQPVNGEYSHFESSYSDRVMYIWGLQPGDYYVYGHNGESSFAQSEPGVIHIGEDGTCTPAALTLTLTEPMLSGIVKTTTGGIFNEGYIQVFNGSEDDLHYILGIPVSSQGEFRLGGLPEGNYYIRACINDNSTASESCSASKITAVNLPSEEPVTLTLNDKSPRFRSVRDAFVNDDRMVVRLVNVSTIGDFINSIQDFDNLSAEIQDLSGNVRLSVTGNDLIIHAGTYDQNLDEVDLELLINGGLKLSHGQYRVVLKNGNETLVCDDSDSGAFNLYYRINTVPYVILPEEAANASVILEIQNDGMPDPIDEADILSVSLTGSDGQPVPLAAQRISGNKLSVTLPSQALSQGWYMFEVRVNSVVAAVGSLVVGNPQINIVNDIAEGDGGILLRGTNLEFFNGNEKAYAKIINSEGKAIYIDDYMNYDGQWLYIEFGCNGLRAGDYTLELGYDGNALELPNGGKFRVISRVYADPACVSANYSSGTTVTLKPMPGVNAPWNVNDTLEIILFGTNKSYVVDDIAITKTDNSLSFVLPVGYEFGSGQINIDVNRLDGDTSLWIATSRFGIAQSLQVSGKITMDDGISGVPHAGVNIYNDNSFYHFDADANGNYSIYGLLPGIYKLQAVPPIGGKYNNSEETEVSITENSPVQSINLELEPVSYFSGRVSLPDGETAPQGGIRYTVGVIDDNGTPEDPGDNHMYFRSYVINEGASSFGYVIPAASDAHNYRVVVWVENNDTYIGENFYSSTGTVYTPGEATLLDASEGDKTNINITLSRGASVSGTISLAEGAIIPAEGIDLEVVALMDNDPETYLDDQAGSVRLHISQGQSSVSYTMVLPANPSDKGYMVFYKLLGDYGLEQSGFYSQAGTVYSPDLHDPIDISSGNQSGIDLEISMPLAPVVLNAYVGSNGDTLELKMSKPLDVNTVTSAGFALVVNGTEYFLSNPMLKDKGTLLVFQTDAVIFKDGENDDIIKLTYESNIGMNQSFDGLDLASFGDRDASNKSQREFRISGPVQDGLYNHDVALTVTASGLSLEIYENDTVIASGSGVVSYTFSEGIHAVSIKAVGLKNPVDLIFTVDKTAPNITIEGCDKEEVLNGSVTPVITFPNDSVENSKTITITKDDEPYAYTAGAALTLPGTYTITASAQDTAGNTKTVTVTFTIIWDDAVPQIITNVTNGGIYESIDLGITLADGTNKDHYDYTAVLTAPGSTTNTYHMGDDLPTLTAEGSYTLVVDVVNHSYQDFTGSATYSFTIDNQAPVAAISGVISEHLYNTSVTPVITFNDTVASQADLEDNATIVLTKDGQVVDYSTGDEISADGAYILSAKTEDGFGHESNLASVSFSIDTAAPSITITGCGNALNEEIRPVVAFSGDCVDETKSATLNGSPYDIDNTPAIRTPGHYVLIVMAKDAAGNMATEQVEFDITWDETNPEITTNLNNGSFYETIAPNINLTGGTNLENYTYSAELTKPDGSKVTYTKADTIPALNVEGVYSLKITAVNPSWQNFTSELTVNFAIDNKAPSIGISAVTNNGLYNVAVKPVISFSDSVAAQDELANNATIELKKDGSVIGYTPGTQISGDGQYVLTVTTHDSNNHIVQKIVTFRIDTTKPIMTIEDCGDIENNMNGVTPKITFNSDCVENTKTATLNGASYDFRNPTAIKAPGVYTLIVSARDAAGNIGSATVTFEIKWDTSAPIISTPGLTSGSVYEAVTPSVVLSGGSNVSNYTYTAKLTKPDGSIVPYAKGEAISADIEGSYKLEITAVNPGYTEISSCKIINFTIDKIAPTAEISSIPAVNNKPVNPVITLTDNVASQALLWNNATITLKKDGSTVASYKPGDVITADGTYILTVQTKDALNHVSYEASVTFIIDCTKPVINISGVLNGYTYKDQDVTLTATANGEPLTLIVNNEQVSLVNNQYAFTGENNKVKSYNVLLTATDEAGNTSQRELTFTIDKQPVNIVVNGIVEGQVINYNPNITYTSFNGTVEQTGTTATLDGTAYNPNTVLAEGKHTLAAKIVLEGVPYTKSISFTIDKTAPSITSIGAGKNGSWTTQPINAKSGDALGIRAKVADTNGLQDVYAVIKLGDVETRIPMIYNQTTQYFEGSYLVGGGDYTGIPLSVYATDKAGNTGNNKTYTNPINLDNTKPMVSRMTNPAAPDGKNGIYVASNMTVVLTAGSGEIINYSLNGTAWQSAVGSVALTPVQGDNVLVFKAQDQAGNIGDERIYVFKYDSVKPAGVDLASPQTGLVNSELLKINGSVDGEGTGTKVILKRGNDVVATADVKTDHTFEFSGVRLLEGENGFTLTAVDYAGNESSQATDMTRTLDTISPLLDIQKNGSLYEITSNEDISGMITAKFNGADVTGSAVTRVSSRSFTVESPEEIDGLNALNVWGSDAAGNTGTGSYSSTHIPATTGQSGLNVGDNTSIDIPDNTFSGETIQMVVRTVDIQDNIEYKPITAPVQFDFSQNPTQPIVVRIQIGMGLTGVMLMHIDDAGNAEEPILATITTSVGFNINDKDVDKPYYLSDTGELVFKTMNFSAYGAVTDNTPPVISITTNDFDINSTDPADIRLTGTIIDTSASVISSVTINGESMNLSGIDAADLDQTFSIPLGITEDDVYEVVITARDSVGNVSDPKSVTYNVDLHAPVLTATCGTTLTNRNTVDITIDVNELSYITLNGAFVTSDEGRFTITTNLGNGVNTLNIAATDILGNITTAPAITVTRDSEPPTITVNGVNDGDTYGAAVNIAVNVTGAVSQTATLDGSPFAGGSCAGEGLHTLTVTAADAAGNTANRTISFTIDTSVPVITVAGAANNGLYTTDQTLDISASNADTLIIAKSVNGGAAQNVPVPGGNLTYSLVLSTANNQQDNYVVVVTARKTIGGQIRAASTTINLAIDKKNPGLTANVPAQTENTTVDITGSVDELSDIYLDGTLVISNHLAGSFTITGRTLVMGDNTFVIKAIDRAGHETSKTVTIKRVAPTDPGIPGGGGLPGGGPMPPAMPAALPGGTVTGSSIIYVPIISQAIATSTLTEKEINEALGNAKPDASGVKTVEIKVAGYAGVETYIQEIPASVLKTGTEKQRYVLDTEIASMTIPGNMFSANDMRNKVNMGISIGMADKNKLSSELRQQVGNRPVLELSATADGKTISWSNPAAPVTITMDYAPTAEELKNPDHIVVLYIDGSGKAVEVPSAKFDPVTRTITFTATHFSKYAVAYVNKTFEDISGAYAKDMIEALASKGFYNWISGTKFNPNRDITRAEFIYLLVTALDLHAQITDNFSDVKPDDYYYEAVGVAKKLGITLGVGNNKVGADMGITRQDMSTILVRALKIAGKNYPDGNTTDLKKFTDAGKITAYAKESLATLIKAGILVGSNGILNPDGSFTMQHAAVVIYKIYKK